uniref:Uncharacterized protein n=1 Tax=Romanomermis culicivorax TaxID=13658 RepID=A0A915J3R1_ROMCU
MKIDLSSEEVSSCLGLPRTTIGVRSKSTCQRTALLPPHDTIYFLLPEGWDGYPDPPKFLDTGPMNQILLDPDPMLTVGLKNSLPPRISHKE